MRVLHDPCAAAIIRRSLVEIGRRKWRVLFDGRAGGTVEAITTPNSGSISIERRRFCARSADMGYRGC